MRALRTTSGGGLRAAAVWVALIAAFSMPVVLAANSPLLAWRQPAYIVAGFAGVIGMALLLVQPLLIGGYLSLPKPLRQRVAHRWVGLALVLAILVHVVGLWLTSPPDVMDALLFVSPTPFSVWGVVAMWAAFASALLAVLRRRLRWRIWRLGHVCLALVVVGGTVVHALLIEGTMETVSKILLCTCAVVASAKAVADLRIFGR